MPVLIYASDAAWGAAAVDDHRELIAALRRRDIAAVVGLTGLAVHRRGAAADRRLREIERTDVLGLSRREP